MFWSVTFYNGDGELSKIFYYKTIDKARERARVFLKSCIPDWEEADMRPQDFFESQTWEEAIEGWINAGTDDSTFNINEEHFED